MENSLLVRAFQVERIPDNFDPTRPPSNGQEYLQYVMFEASNCPQVVVADIDRSRFDNNIDIKITIDKISDGCDLAPTQEWQQDQVSKFSELRDKVDKARESENFRPVSLPREREEDKWYEFFFGDGDVKREPYLSVLLSMNEMLLGQVLEYQVEWLEHGLKPNQGKWIYAILACISRPLTCELCCTLRDLARTCIRLRRGKTLPDDPEVVTLNLLICLVGRFFGQLDLAD